MRKNKSDNTTYQNKYYHSHPELKKIQTDRARLNYWKKKYCNYTGITIITFNNSFRKKWDESRLKKNTIELEKSIMRRIRK
jgi:hypothetical protein